MNEAELRRRARARIEVGMLPSSRPVRSFAGMGSGERCALCDVPINRNEIEDEIEVVQGEALRVLKFHRPCASAWALERTQERGGS